MANVRISQLPAAPSAITGAELVPVVQNGQTVQTTVNALISSPSLTQTFLTKVQEPSLPNSRYLGVGAGLGITDAGAQNLLQISPAGALASLVNSSTGIQVKTDATTLTNRSIAVSGNGISISNGSGVSGDPTLSLSGLALALANTVGTGILNVRSSATVNLLTITGTSDQIAVSDGAGSVGNPTIALASNPIIPGSAAVRVPTGTTAERSAFAGNGDIRYNTDTALFEGYLNGSWSSFASGSGVTSVATGTGLTGGPITSTGTISIADTAVTAGSYGSATEVGTFTVNAQGQLTAAANVAITAGGIGAVASVSGTANEITATGTTNVTLSLPSALTFTGKTVTGGAFNMTSATVGSDTVTTNTASQTLTNKTISGASNTLSNIGNSSLTNSSITLGTTNIALGGTSLTPAGLTSVTVTQNPTTALQLATKQYVDTLAASGIHYHEPVYVESPDTAGNLNATYNQPGGAGDGVGATLTNAGTQVALTIDGVLMTVGKRVLIYNQTNQVQNGVYTVTVVGTASTNWVLTRATDADTYAPFSPNSLGQGDAFFVQAGTTGVGETYICNTVGTIVFGTTNITFAQISSVQVYSAGTGLTLTGTQFSISDTAVTAGAYGSATQVGTFTVNAQGQLTLAGNTTVTPAVGSITGLGTGVATALAVNTGSAGAFVVNGGALGTPSSGTVTNLTGTASININGTVGATTANTGAFTTISATGQISSTLTGSATDGAGQVYLNGATSNRVEWRAVGTGAPAFTTRSAGTKLLLYPSLSGSITDYAIGIDAATMWSSVPENNASFKFKWYGAITEIASLTGTGAFTAIGGISSGTF